MGDDQRILSVSDSAVRNFCFRVKAAVVKNPELMKKHVESIENHPRELKRFCRNHGKSADKAKLFFKLC